LQNFIEEVLLHGFRCNQFCFFFGNKLEQCGAPIGIGFFR
jgi:hypothetical protein